MSKSAPDPSIDIWNANTPYKYAINNMIKNDSKECEEFIKKLEEAHKLYVKLKFFTDIDEIDDAIHRKFRSMLDYNSYFYDKYRLYLSKGDESFVKKQILPLSSELSKFINLGYSNFINKKLKREFEKNKPINAIDTIFIVLMANLALIMFLNVTY